MDLWNPKTFDPILCDMLSKHSDLILDYYAESCRLMEAHLNNKPYESLKANSYGERFTPILEETFTPMMRDRRIRVWHYTRLLDYEVALMQKDLVPSTCSGLKQRLKMLVDNALISDHEKKTILSKNLFHQEEQLRSNQVWATALPRTPNDSGVVPLLESWGGEVVYASFSDPDEIIAAKLKTIGTPRVVEIETLLETWDNYFSAQNVTEAWARKHGVPVKISHFDVKMTDCLDTAKVLRVHTEGDGVFEKIATAYPFGYN